NSNSGTQTVFKNGDAAVITFFVNLQNHRNPFLSKGVFFIVYSFFLLLLCPFLLPIALNEAAKINGKTATEDTPPAKKIRRCQRQQVKREPVAGGKADNDRTEDKQESVKTLLLKGKAPVDPECTAKVGKVRDSH
uniref:Uncharacterized protein n=1 Tax=Sus scrofa TaxID=9823 RepID=A0A8D0X7R7_PIG